MKVFRSAAVIVLLTGPAYAQNSTPNINLIPELQSKTPEEKEAEAVRDKAYKESLRKIPDAKVSSDPWGSVRGAETPKTSAPAKPRTKTGSTESEALESLSFCLSMISGQTLRVCPEGKPVSTLR